LRLAGSDEVGSGPGSQSISTKVNYSPMVLPCGHTGQFGGARRQIAGQARSIGA